MRYVARIAAVGQCDAARTGWPIRLKSRGTQQRHEDATKQRRDLVVRRVGDLVLEDLQDLEPAGLGVQEAAYMVYAYVANCQDPGPRPKSLGKAARTW